MTDKLTKSQIADRLLDFGITLSVNQVKKTSHADLQHMLATELRKTAKPVRVRDTELKALPEKVWPCTKKAADITAARAGTKRALILTTLHKGCTIEDLMQVTSWTRATCQSAITTDVQGAGYGVRRDAKGVLHLVLPKGLRRPAIVDEGETRAAAVSAACR